MNSRLSKRVVGLVLAACLALASAGCEVVAGVGVGYGYPNGWSGYGGPSGGWYGGPVYP
jgi:hypothetical protein